MDKRKGKRYECDIDVHLSYAEVPGEVIGMVKNSYKGRIKNISSSIAKAVITRQRIILNNMVYLPKMKVSAVCIKMAVFKSKKKSEC